MSALTAAETARTLGVSVRTLSRYIDDGLIEPSGRTGGGHRRFDPEVVEALRVQLAGVEPTKPPPRATELPTD